MKGGSVMKLNKRLIFVPILMLGAAAAILLRIEDHRRIRPNRPAVMNGVEGTAKILPPAQV
jgi:hypothetical protein